MRQGAPAAIWTLAGAFVLIELVLSAGDIGMAPRDLRTWAYAGFAFFDPFFDAARRGEPVPAQLWWSFLSHAFLHGGLLHMAMNTAVFLALGAHVSRAVGTTAALLLFLGTAIGGAVGFGLIADTGGRFIPMVGASGALFGYLGAMKRWEWRFLSENALPRRRFWGTLLGLALINVLLTVGLSVDGGGVAWETHLGGFVAGWLGAGALRPRPGMSIGPI
jgi:membrane associated rhomboid family serine protease